MSAMAAATGAASAGRVMTMLLVSPIADRSSFKRETKFV
eukprot:gene25650-5670_t